MHEYIHFSMVQSYILFLKCAGNHNQKVLFLTTHMCFSSTATHLNVSFCPLKLHLDLLQAFSQVPCSAVYSVSSLHAYAQ